ncbi:MAG: SpoIIE family protein phosphatase [Chloroflexota bacterium]
MLLGELRTIAVIDSLRMVSSFIHAIGHRLQLTDKVLHDLDLAVDEAATNIVKHAYPAGEPGDMVIRAETSDADMITITLRDFGVPFNPDHIRPFDLSEPIERRIHGGMGLYFIHHLMDAVERRTGSKPGDANDLILFKRVDRLKPGERRPSSTRELNVLMNVSQEISQDLELDQLLQVIADQVTRAVDAEWGMLYLVDEVTNELVSRVRYADQLLSEVRLPSGQGIVGEVAYSGQVINLPDVYADPRFDPAFEERFGLRCRTMLVAPMRNPQQKVVGVLQLINKQSGVFSARDERLLTAIAAQAAISVENARLYEREIERQLIKRELETARTIQKSFLPQAVPDLGGWQIAAHWRPMQEVAGDFYDFYPLPDGRLALLIADVSGKSISASLFMALSVTMLRVAMSMELSPAEVLERTNESMIFNQKSRMFTTVFLAYLDPVSQRLICASAGHNPPFLYREASGECEALTEHGVALGVFRGVKYENFEVNMQAGDVLVLYTDGITEIVNVDEIEFGEERLEQIILTHATASADELATKVVKEMNAFAAVQGAYDDETMVILKCENR